MRFPYVWFLLSFVMIYLLAGTEAGAIFVIVFFRADTRSAPTTKLQSNFVLFTINYSLFTIHQQAKKSLILTRGDIWQFSLRCFAQILRTPSLEFAHFLARICRPYSVCNLFYVYFCKFHSYYSSCIVIILYICTSEIFSFEFGYFLCI